MDKNLEILKRLIIEAEAEVETEEETEEVVKPGSFEENPMEFILKKYATLNELLVELMTDSFQEYVDGIFIMAPKPTTFKVLLHNGQVFFLSYLDPNYEATIEGKRYYLLGIGEKERCMVAISRLLRYGTPLKIKGPEGAEQGANADEMSAEGSSLADTGAAPEETEEAPEEALTESMNILKRLILEAAKKEENQDLSKKILDLLSLDPNLAEYEPYKVERDPKSVNNYKAYFKNVNTKDKKGRRDILTLLTTAEGIKNGEVMPKYVGWSSIGYSKLNTDFGEVNISPKGFSENATTTNVKEGLVIPFYYSSLKDLITEDTFESSIKATIKATIVNEELIGPKLSAELLEYLNSLENTKANIKIINQPLSQALAIYKAYPERYELNRGDILNDYRQFASQQLSMNYDKWCPADLYLIIREGGAKARLKKAIIASKKDTPGSAIEVLNNSFNEKWGGILKPITGISLKFEKAQGGKAKSYLETIANSKTEYNLNKEEKEYSEQEYLDGIEAGRKKLASQVKGVDGIEYIVLKSEKAAKKDIETLRSKFAGLKCLNFFFSKFPKDKYDDALLGLSAFAMSLSDTSPAFFKVKGSTTGEAEVEPFPRGASLSLLENGDEYEMITIEDSPTNGEIAIKMKVSKGGDPQSVIIKARSGGGMQGTMELTVGPIKE